MISATSVYSLFFVAPIGCGVCVGSLFCGLGLGVFSSLEEERAGCFTLIE